MATATSSQARAAACIRKDLKRAFPATKFSVTSQGYSMGDHVNVSWVDGPTREEVEDLIGKYEQGHFDGMTDCYESSNRRTDIPQTKYLFCDRDASPARTRAAIDWLNQHTSVKCSLGERGEIVGEYNQEWQDWPCSIVHRMLSGHYCIANPEMDFSKGDAR